MESKSTLAPTQAKERLASLDVIRGVAVLGILLMNITEFGLPHQAYSDPTVYGGHEGANLTVWIVNAMLFEGTQRALFTLLFGAGVILFTERMENSQQQNATDLFFRRNLWLVVFGVVHGFLLLWIGDVLFFYGVLALFAYAFRKVSPKTLLWLAVGGLAFNVAWNQLDNYNAKVTYERWSEAVVAKEAGEELTSDQSSAIDAWRKIMEERKPDEKELQKAIDATRGTYLEQVAFQASERNEFQMVFLYRGFFDMFSMMLIGMALFRGGLLIHPWRFRRVYWSMIFTGYSIGLTINFFEVRHLIEADFGVLAQLKANVTYDVGRLAMTLGHVGLLMLFCKAQKFERFKRRLAAVGQMAFTNYIAQSIICALVFYGLGFGLFGHLQRYELYYVVLAIWVFQIITSSIWLAQFRYGPLEWLWRSLTYGQRQPIRNRPSVRGIAAPST